MNTTTSNQSTQSSERPSTWASDPFNPTNSLTKEQRKQILADRRAKEHAEGIKWAAKRFGIPESEVLGYNSGCCYSKVWVKTREVAEKVAKRVEGDTVNGGMFHGMSLGAISEYDGMFEVMV